MQSRVNSRSNISGVADVWTHEIDKIDEVLGISEMAFCLVKDISITGLGVFSTTRLEKGTNVSIKRLNFNKRIYFERLYGTVIWISGNDRAYNMGIKFHEPLNKYKHTALYSTLFGNSESFSSNI